MPGRKEAKHLLKIADTAGEKAIIEQRYVVNAGPAASMIDFLFSKTTDTKPACDRCSRSMLFKIWSTF